MIIILIIVICCFELPYVFGISGEFQREVRSGFEIKSRRNSMRHLFVAWMNSLSEVECIGLYDFFG